MNDMQVFGYHTGRRIRTFTKDGEPWFAVVDVCDILDIGDARRAAERLDEDERSQAPVIDAMGREQQTWIVNESGLYNLILRSDKPEAKPFRKWITGEVLPSIRKTGSYSSQFKIPQTLPDALRLAADLADEVEKQKAIIQEQAPKVEFFDAVSASKDAIDIGMAAKVLNLGIGRNKLFEILRKKQVLMDGNIPYQCFIDRGYFRVVEQKFRKSPEREANVSFKTLVYQKGLQFIQKTVQGVQ